MKTKSINTLKLRPVASWRRLLAFTLIEIMVVMALLSVIILGLMAMFDQTQKAFRTGMSQTDRLEGGRMFTDLLRHDIEQITPCYQTNGMNFYVQIPDYGKFVGPAVQTLPGSTLPRTNILENLFFLSRYNQTWSGVGYFVRTNDTLGFGGPLDLVGSLYRFEMDVPISQMQGDNSLLPYNTFLNATNNAPGNTPNRFSISKVLDGVIDFRVHCYDTNGYLLTETNIINNSFFDISNSLVIPNEISFYGFSNNIVPAYVEVQLGVLDPDVLKRFNSIPDPAAKSNFLFNHAGAVQLFRQRIAIRNVSPCAYTTNNCFSN